VTSSLVSLLCTKIKLNRIYRNSLLTSHRHINAKKLIVYSMGPIYTKSWEKLVQVMPGIGPLL